MNKDEMKDLALTRYLEYVKEKDKANQEQAKEIKKRSKKFFNFILREKRGETEWNEQLEEFYAPLLSLTASSPEGIRVFRDEIIKKEILDFLDIFNPELIRQLNSRIKQSYIHALTEALIANKEVEDAREAHVRGNIKAQGVVSSFFNFRGKKNKSDGEWTD